MAGFPFLYRQLRSCSDKSGDGSGKLSDGVVKLLQPLFDSDKKIAGHYDGKAAAGNIGHDFVHIFSFINQ